MKISYPILAENVNFVSKLLLLISLLRIRASFGGLFLKYGGYRYSLPHLNEKFLTIRTMEIASEVAAEQRSK